jgi:hypothetical protein
MFDSFDKVAWWFGFWTLFKAFFSAVVITNVLNPVSSHETFPQIFQTSTMLAVLAFAL